MNVSNFIRDGENNPTIRLQAKSQETLEILTLPAVFFQWGKILYTVCLKKKKKETIWAWLLIYLI